MVKRSASTALFSRAAVSAARLPEAEGEPQETPTEGSALGFLPADPKDPRLTLEGLKMRPDGRVDVNEYEDLKVHFVGEPSPDRHPDPEHPGVRDGEVVGKGMRIWDDLRAVSTDANASEVKKDGAGWIATFNLKNHPKREKWFNIRTCGSWRLAFLLASLQRRSWVAKGLAAKVGNGKKSSAKKDKDPNKPKRPAGGAFGCFMEAHRPELLLECAGQPVTATTKLAAERWKLLSEEARLPFEEAYAKKKAAYEEAMKSYVPPAVAESEAGEDEEAEEEEDGAAAAGQKKRKVEPDSSSQENSAAWRPRYRITGKCSEAAVRAAAGTQPVAARETEVEEKQILEADSGVAKIQPIMATPPRKPKAGKAAPASTRKLPSGPGGPRRTPFRKVSRQPQKKATPQPAANMFASSVRVQQILAARAKAGSLAPTGASSATEAGEAASGTKPTVLASATAEGDALDAEAGA